MISVNETMRRHEFASCNWYIPWDCLISIPLKTGPVTVLEPVFTDGRMCWVETQIPLQMRLQITKDTSCLIKVPNVGHCKVAQ